MSAAESTNILRSRSRIRRTFLTKPFGKGIVRKLALHGLYGRNK